MVRLTSSGMRAPTSVRSMSAVVGRHGGVSLSGAPCGAADEAVHVGARRARPRAGRHRSRRRHRAGRGRASGRAPRRGGARRSWACRRPGLDGGRVDEADGEVGVPEAEPGRGLQGRQPDGPLPVAGRDRLALGLQLGHPALEPLGLRELGVGDLPQVGAVLRRLAPCLGQLALEDGDVDGRGGRSVVPAAAWACVVDSDVVVPAWGGAPGSWPLVALVLSLMVPRSGAGDGGGEAGADGGGTSSGGGRRSRRGLAPPAGARASGAPARASSPAAPAPTRGR